MYKAIYIGENFLNCCRLGIFGYVHSVFSRAVNIRMINGDLKTILCQEGDIMTAAVTVSALDLNDLNHFVMKNNRILFTPNVIYIENIPKIYGLAHAQIWLNNVEKPMKFCNHLALLYKCRKIETFLYEEARYDYTSLSTIAKKHPISHLIGLGSGLTPSGDDFICGVLLVLSYMQKAYDKKYKYFKEICTDIKENLYQTNEISIHFLKHALQGHMGKLTHTLLSTIFCDEEAMLFDALSKKMRYGATSGMDEICGILHGIRLFLKDEKTILTTNVSNK